MDGPAFVSGAEDQVARQCVDELGRLVLAEHSFEDVLRRAVTLVRLAVPACEGAAIAVCDGVAGHVVVRSDPVVERVDQVQFESGAGPTIDCLRDHRPHGRPDLDGHAASRAFAGAAIAEDLVDWLAVPVEAGGAPIGALTLFARESGTLALDRPIRAFLAGAGVVVANARQLFIRRNEARVLEDRLSGDEELIALANGILRVRYELSADEAHERLRDDARADGVEVVAAARAVIRSVTPGN